MILIDVRGKTFDEYIKSITQKARKNYAYVRKHNKDLIYKMIPYGREEMERFMGIWEQQLIRGTRRRWAFRIGYLDRLEELGKLRCFAAYKGNETVAMHFVENHKGYVECHPPMYEKEKYSKRYMAKFMWFSLIRHAIESNDMEWIDMGGGGESNWRDMIINRDKYPNPQYKWMYVPKEVKDHPEKQPRLAVKEIGDEKFIIEI